METALTRTGSKACHDSILAVIGVCACPPIPVFPHLRRTFSVKFRVMRLGTLIASAAVLILLAGCGSGAEKKPSGGADEGRSVAKSDSSSDDSKPSVKLVAQGFGQSDEYPTGIAIVTTNSKASIGESVTVSANLMDAKGQILATEEQIEQFNWTGQELVLPISFDLSNQPHARATKIEASASISDYGMRGEEKAPLPTLNSAEVKMGEYGGRTASFAFKNTTKDALKGIRVGIVCYNKAGSIIGGSSEYPSLAAPGATIRIDSDVTTSGMPANCKAFPNYDVS
jgi:hypothetical protein